MKKRTKEDLEEKWIWCYENREEEFKDEEVVHTEALLDDFDVGTVTGLCSESARRIADKEF